MLGEILAARTQGVSGHGYPENRTTARIRGMTGRGLRITARIVFCVCGLVSLLTAAPYAMLQGVGLPYQREWVIFVVALGAVGAFSIAVGVMRRNWIAKLCKTDRDDARVYSIPFKLLGGFALISYLLAVFAHFAPQTWNLNPQIMLALCPMYLVKMTFDPSAALVFFLLAPMNAGVYGSLGAMVGYGSLAFHKDDRGKLRRP